MAANTFQINQFTRVHDDRCGVDSFYRQSVGPGFWATTNLVPNAATVIPQALDNPTIIAKEGYGLLPKNIDNDSILRNHAVQENRQRCPIHPQARPFVTVPYMGRGRGEPVLEAKLQQSEFVRTGKDRLRSNSRLCCLMLKEISKIQFTLFRRTLLQVGFKVVFPADSIFAT
jgi:hypothetical protein